MPLAPPLKPPTGGRTVLVLMATMAAAFAFVQGSRILLSVARDPAVGRVDPVEIVLLWALPVVVVAIAALFARSRGWTVVALGLWIYVGLGILTSVACGVLASTF